MMMVFYNLRPGPITSLLTLIHPFDAFIWMFTVLSIVSIFLALLLSNLPCPHMSGKDDRIRQLTVFQAVLASLSPVLSDGVPYR